MLSDSSPCLFSKKKGRGNNLTCLGIICRQSHWIYTTSNSRLSERKLSKYWLQIWMFPILFKESLIVYLMLFNKNSWTCISNCQFHSGSILKLIEAFFLLITTSFLLENHNPERRMFKYGTNSFKNK